MHRKQQAERVTRDKSRISVQSSCVGLPLSQEGISHVPEISCELHYCRVSGLGLRFSCELQYRYRYPVPLFGRNRRVDWTVKPTCNVLYASAVDSVHCLYRRFS